MNQPVVRILLTTALVAACVGACSGATRAAEPALRGDVVVSRDTLTLGDLVENAPKSLAETPLFRAPALGASGTIQSRRVVTAAEALGLAVQTGGRIQVTVTRAARRIGPTEIEGALRKRLAAEFGLDPATLGIAFDGNSPLLLASPDVAGEPTASELSYDRRARRLSASIWLGPSAAERRAQIRVSGTIVDLVEVTVAGRALERGQTVKAGDFLIERRPRDVLAHDAAHDGAALDGRVLRRAVAAGTIVRPADLIRPEIVARGDIVTASYEGRGIALSLQVKANDGGALGDTVAVTNPHSKKVLQAVVTGPGRVAVGGPAPGRIASVATPRVTP
jgi:flagella basal body P-ring formation protein FlgA